METKDFSEHCDLITVQKLRITKIQETSKQGFGSGIWQNSDPELCTSREDIKTKKKAFKIT